MEEIPDEFLNKLRSNDSSLKEIQLCRKISDGYMNISNICIALKENNTVKKLYLSFNDINDDGANNLSDALTGNNTVTMIYLAYNKISASGAKKLTAILANNKTIKSFNIASNNIGDVGAKEFAEVLRKNKRVMSLDISSNQISDIGIKAIADALVENTTLRSLRLAGNAIEDVGRSALTQALKINRTLTEIILEEDGYLDDEIDKFVRRNKYLMMRRRDIFIHAIITLAADSTNPNSQSFWSWLSADLKLYICSYLFYKGVDYIGKRHQEVYTCAKFIFNNTKALRLGLKRGCSFKIYERRGEQLHSPTKFSFTFFYKAMEGINEVNLIHSKDGRIANFKVITIVTYAQVLAKKNLIINLTTQFGYSEEVTIHYDVPLEGEEKITLCFIVKEILGKEVPHDNKHLLSAKLAAELGCEANIKAYEYIPNLYRYDNDRKSALITDEKAIKKVIYKINNGLNNETPLSDIEIDTINLEDIECKNIEGEKDDSLQRILLKQAEEYLKKNAPPETQNVSNAGYDAHGLLGEKRHKTAASLEEESQKKKSRPSVEPSDGQMPPSVNGNGSSSPRKTS